MDLRDLLLRFDGRIGRKDYWIGTAVVVAISLGGLLVALFVGGAIAGRPGAALLAGAFNIAATIPAIALSLKRSNDRGYPQEPVFAIFAANIAYQLVDMLSFGMALGSLRPALWIMVLGGLWMLVDLGFMRGASGPNRYGPDPSTGR